MFRIKCRAKCRRNLIKARRRDKADLSYCGSIITRRIEAACVRSKQAEVTANGERRAVDGARCSFFSPEQPQTLSRPLFFPPVFFSRANSSFISYVAAYLGVNLEAVISSESQNSSFIRLPHRRPNEWGGFAGR